MSYRGVCCDPRWGPNQVGSPDPDLLLRLGITRVRIISAPGLDWFIDACWQRGIMVRAVVVDGYYCRADAYFVLNEPNLNNMSAQQFAQELQIHRRQYPDLELIAGGLGDATRIGIDAAAYMSQVIAAGGLVGYNGVDIHYPLSATRIAAFKKVLPTGMPIHVAECNVENPLDVSDYLTKVIKPYARTADYFCVNDGMRDPGWRYDMGLFTSDWQPKSQLRRWLAET